jgi:hypothetical protein
MFTGSGPKARAEANKTTVALAQEQTAIAETAKKKKVARKPVQTVYGGANGGLAADMTQQSSGGATLGA